jgi:hypothetical protein
MSDASIDGRREQGQPDRQETAPLDRSFFEFFEYVQSEDASPAFWRAERGTANAERRTRTSELLPPSSFGVTPGSATRAGRAADRRQDLSGTR